MSKKSNKNITRKEALKKIIFSTILLLLLTTSNYSQTFISNYSPAGGGAARGSYVDGNYCYTSFSISFNGIKIIDISDKSNPTEVGSIQSSSETYNTQIIGNNLFFSNMGDGVKIYNISNPSSPSLVNTVDTNTDAGGNWQSLAMGY